MRFIRSLAEVVGITAMAVLVVVACRQYLFNPYSISGASMAPNFHDGDYVFVDQVTYRFRAPERGEVVVFHSPSLAGEDLLKRIIGLPGERVVVRDGAVTIFNSEHPAGMVLDESYLDTVTLTTGSADLTLKESQYFMMGDNRSVSYDSRSWGALDKSYIVGLVRLRIWPPDATRVFAAPRY